MPVLTPIFLPISQATATAFLERGELPALAVERAALFVLQSLLGSALEPAGLDRLLMQSTPLFEQQPQAGEQALRGFRASLDDAEDGNALAERLAVRGIGFAPERPMAERAWEDPDAPGQYCADFQELCRRQLQDFPVPAPAINDQTDDAAGTIRPRTEATLATAPFRGTRDQAVAATLIARCDDEHVAIDAYAGTGKTHLILALHERLGTHFTYVAPSQAQLYAFQRHGHGGAGSMRATTLWQLAHQIAAHHARAHGLARAPRCEHSTFPPDEQARLAGIGALDGRSPVQVLAVLKQAINAWCYSEDPYPQPQHFRRALPHTQADRAAWVAACWQLWQAMFKPPPARGPLLDITLPQLLKWLVLHRAAIPAGHGTLVVDEAHDLPAAWHTLLESYAGGCVLLGDPHQRVRGSARQAPRAKRLAMHQSVRMGLLGERLVEQTLELAPRRLIDTPFSGSPAHITVLQRYRAGSELPNQGLRVYGSPWPLLEAALRLKDQTAPFRLLPASAEALSRTVTRAINLFRHGDTYRGSGVEGLQRWDELATRLMRQGRAAIVRLFERGFDGAALGQLLAAQAADGEQRLTLGLLEHARNLEADVVALADCCFEAPSAIGGNDYNPINAAYLGMTRARHELWLPGDALERLAGQAR